MELPQPDREYLASEVAAYLDQVRDPTARRVYGELQTAIDEGEVPEELEETLGELLELSLSTGRLRRLYGAHAEMSAMRLFGRTPQGRRQAEAVSEVNQALQALAGQQIEQIVFTPRGPGTFHLHLETDRCRVQVVIDREAVHVKALET